MSMREHGLSFQEWGKTFEMTPEEKYKLGQYAADLLSDPRFQAILAEMEYNLCYGFRSCKVIDQDNLKSIRYQFHALQQLRSMLQGFVVEKKMREQLARSKDNV